MLYVKPLNKVHIISGGGGHSLITAEWGRVARQGMVFRDFFFILNRVSNLSLFLKLGIFSCKFLKDDISFVFSVQRNCSLKFSLLKMSRNANHRQRVLGGQTYVYHYCFRYQHYLFKAIAYQKHCIKPIETL